MAVELAINCLLYTDIPIAMLFIKGGGTEITIDVVVILWGGG